jgi:hypothetical protein
MLGDWQFAQTFASSGGIVWVNKVEYRSSNKIFRAVAKKAGKSCACKLNDSIGT